ncbi:TPA: restriction endonuclease subunit S [Haemophilus influenzae]|uniref:restriction endonuclease subunit S n=1 Tax=Haemophilus influenzae TaxID=727 RepID=UPI000680B467|nr:restriction endonuclease subunit S [Haemophilus influenzae]KMZ22190.1 restriction endonuclease subunit S [Haemophilus influenzae]MCK8884438.1 restriction endonuclease subunit S [Haemophilus influenzae]PRI47405.1 putative type-1 restriction enzyme specificity protein [Haemophilus influenzae]PRM37817.1 putative type-1 restriction enzyme specificity protein [Haemophilus influenzae]
MKNNRTFLEKLLDGAEVEWKTLDEISSIYGGLTGKGKADFENGNALYVPYKNIFNNIEVDFNNLDTVNVSDDEKQYTIKYGDVLFTGSSETAEEAGMSSAVTTKTEQKIYLNSFSFGLRFNDDIELLPEFSKFLFRTLSIRKEIVKSASGVTRFNISKARFKKIKIPIPPLSVQTEIVRILDALTALTSELTRELILRQKQYEYYREKLLSEEELGKVGFEWKPLGEVTNIKIGQAVSKYSISQNPGIYPVINSGREPLGFINEWNTENDPIGITTRGAGVGSITWQEGKYFRGNLNYSVTVKSDYKLNVRFLYHILLYFQKEIHNLCSFTGIPALNASELKKLEISIPAIEEQQRIVSILDKFEDLTNSITDGLPLAIEQSQKRYEYYRELLLSFS